MQTRRGTLMQVRILGQVEAVDGDRGALALGGPTQRRVLAALALRRNEVVSVPYLVDVVWPEGSVPNRADHNVRTYVHRLRSGLGGDGDRLETVGAGYRLRLDDDELDAARFERLASTAARLVDTGDAVAALDAIAVADDLWRGAPLEEFAHEDWAIADAARLRELRADVSTRRAAALLEAGRPADAVVVLERLVADEPLRERPRALLMRALYESGRQAEALRAFQHFRRLLIDEIGVEPSDDLAELDRAIATGALSTAASTTRTAGGYELHERIGEGAFAVVHRATQTSLGRQVAVKIIRAELANRPEFIRRFEAEAQIVARIEHPSVVPLYDYWREPDRAFLVMRWMAGGSLETRLDDGPWPVDATIELVEQIAAALDAAHRHGVVHRDVKPANILFDEAGRAVLGDFGIALGADERARPEAALSEGSPVFAAPEQLRREPVGPEADVHALGIVAYTMLAGRTPFADAPDEPTLLQRQLQEPIPSSRAHRAELPTAVDDVLAVATAKWPADRYPTASGFAAAFRTACTGGDGRPDRSVAVRPLANPYKGLRAFDETDAADFHGRERLVDELVGHLAQPDAALLAVVGPSGSGKSSVVRAGLVPALRAGAVAGSADWFTTTLVPDSQPFEALETALLRIAVNPPAALLEQLRDGDRGILRAIRRIVPDDRGVVAIVIDQFEELFTGVVADDDRDLFLRALAVAAAEPGSPVRLLLTLRADFYDRPLRHPEFARLLKQHTVVVTPLAPDELEHAIVSPAASVGVGFEPGLVAEIVADVNHEPGALPLLQYALTQAFDAVTTTTTATASAPGGTITIEAYRSIGGLTGALARRAEELYTAASPDEQLAARRLFGRLVTLGEGTEDTRRRVRRTELGNDPATDPVVDRFGRARLLTFDHDPATREPTVEIAHEAVFREWPSLRAWLDDDRDGLRIHRHLTETASAWAATGRDPGELYRGGRLDGAAAWSADHDRDLNDDERQFLAASIAARDAEDRAERSRVARLRHLVAIAASVAAIALVAGAVAVWQWDTAGERADEARANATEAAANADEAERNAAQADLNAEQAETNAQLARSNADDAAASAALADQRADEAIAAQQQADLERMRAVALDSSDSDPTVAALLAIEAHRLDPSVESLDALQRVLTEIPGYDGSAAGGPYLDAALLDDATLIAASDTALDVWDLSERAKTRRIEHASPRGLARIELAADGRIVALDADRTSSTVYEIATGETAATLEHGDVVNDITVSPDGRHLAVAMTAGAVGVWDIDAGETSVRLDAGPTDVSFVRWHPDGNRLAIVNVNAGVQLWDVADVQPLWVNPDAEFSIANEVNPFAAAFSPSGERFAYVAGSINGGVITLDSADGRIAVDRLGIPGLEGFPIDLSWTGEQTLVIPGQLSTVGLDLTTGATQPIAGPYVLTGRSVSYSPGIDRWVVAGTGGLEFWSSDGSGPLVRTITLPADQFASLARSGGPMLTSLADDGTSLLTSVFEAPVPAPVSSIDLTSEPPTSIEVPGLGIVIGAGEFTIAGTDFRIFVLDRDLQAMGTPVPLPPDFSELGFSEGGDYFAFGRLGARVDVFRSSGEFVGTVELGSPQEFAGVQNAPSFTSDGRYMAVSTTDGRAGLWRTDGLERIELPAERRTRWLVALGPWLWAQGENGTAQRLDPDTLDEIGDPVPLYGRSALGYPRYDASRERVAVTGPPGVTVIDVDTGRQLGRDLPWAGGSSRIEFSGDGSILTVPRPDGTIVLWNFDTDAWVDIACTYAGRNFSADEWAQVGPRTIEYRATCEQYPIDQ